MSQNGKGSRSRTKNTKQFRENYDNIFRKTNFQKQKKSFVKACEKVQEVNGAEFDRALEYLSTRQEPKSYSDWGDKHLGYVMYLEDFCFDNGLNSDKVPLTEHEFNNIKDYEV